VILCPFVGVDLICDRPSSAVIVQTRSCIIVQLINSVLEWRLDRVVQVLLKYVLGNCVGLRITLGNGFMFGLG